MTVVSIRILLHCTPHLSILDSGIVKFEKVPRQFLKPSCLIMSMWPSHVANIMAVNSAFGSAPSSSRARTAHAWSARTR